MVLSFLKDNRIGNLIFVPLWAIMLWIGPYLRHDPVLPSESIVTTPLYQYLSGFIDSVPYLSAIIGLLLLLFLTFQITSINQRYLILETRSYIIPIFFILISSLYIPLNNLHPGLIGAMFLFFSLNKLFSVFHVKGLGSHLFDSAFYLSIGSLFYFNILWFIPVIWIGQFILRPASIREFLIVPIGIIVPYILYFAYFYVTGSTEVFTASILENFSDHEAIMNLNISHYLFFMFMAFIFIPASFNIYASLNSKKISARKYLWILFWLLVNCFSIFFLVPSAGLEMLPLAAISLSFLLSSYFLGIRNQLTGNVLITVFMLLILAYQFYPLIIVWLQ
jgi:hypothetical protein